MKKIFFHYVVYSHSKLEYKVLHLYTVQLHFRHIHAIIYAEKCGYTVTKVTLYSNLKDETIKIFFIS